MIGTIIWITTALLAVTTICLTVSFLSEFFITDVIKNTAKEQNVTGWVQGVIDSVGDNHAKFSLSYNGKKFANIDVKYDNCSGSIYSGKTISTYV